MKVNKLVYDRPTSEIFEVHLSGNVLNDPSITQVPGGAGGDDEPDDQGDF